MNNKQQNMPSQSRANLSIDIHTSRSGEPTQRQKAHSEGAYLKPLFTIKLSAGINLIKLLLTLLPCPNATRALSLLQPSSTQLSQFTYV